MKILFKNATLLPEYGFGREPVFVSVNAERITRVSTEKPQETFDRVIDCHGNLLMPAFYNAHCHSAMTLFRGYGEDLPLQRWLDERILPAEDRLGYISTYYGSKLAIAEMIRNGVVSFSDMYMFEEATAQAAIECGVKANLSRCVVTFDPDVDMSTDKRMREAIRLAEDFQSAGDGRIVIDMSLHAEYTNVEAGCRQMAEYAAENGFRMQIHLSETESEVEKCRGRHGVSPVRFFADTGVLDLPASAAHCVWVDDEDLDILKEKDVTVVHNPVSNLKLGSGVMPLRTMLDKGIRVALGTDGAASNNRLDVLREMQTAAILHKGVNHRPDITTAGEMIPLATRNGALAQGREDCGLMRPGFRADLILVDLNAIHNRPVYDVNATLAYSAASTDVLMTMADGCILYENGAYTSLDVEALRAEADEVFRHYFD